MNLFPFTHPDIVPKLTDLQARTPFGIQYSNLGITNLGVQAISWITFKDIYTPLNVPLTISECLISVKQTPRIIKQNTISSNGTVKTYLGQDDWVIEIEGYIFNVNLNGTSAANMEGIYPAQRMQTLNNILLGQNNTLGLNIECPFLQQFGEAGGIDYIVITNVEFDQEEGIYDHQKFTIEALSDVYPDLLKVYSPYFG